MVTRLRNGGKTAQRNREESAACARPTFQQPTQAVLPNHHRDPLDRLLVAQAQVEGVPLVSADVTLDSYGITRIWGGESGEPVVLTINGRAELVVQDAASYQKLIELAEQAEEREITRRAVAEMKAGLGRPAAEMLAEMQQVINQKRGQ